MPELYPFQEESVRFLLSRPHCLLADDPGVGKTPPVCVALPQVTKVYGRWLIICPTGIKDTWAHRLLEWNAIQHLSHVQVLNTGKDKLLPGKRCYIVSPAIMLNPIIQAQLLSFKYDCIVVDEADQFKNWDAEGSKFLYQVLLPRAINKWLLTGTFMPNRPIEMYLALKCLAPELIAPYDTYEKYTKRYCSGYFDSIGWNVNGSSHLKDLRKRIKPFMLRRELRDVYPELPGIIEDTIFIPTSILESERNTPLPTLERLVGVAKIQGVVDYLRDRLYNFEGKILVFTRNRQVTEEVFQHLIGFKQWVPLKYYGRMSSLQKSLVLDAFQNSAEHRILIANRRSLGVAQDGLQNCCNHVVEAQFDWCRGLTDQGYGRLVRNGQTNKVRITRMIASDTIEEAMLYDYRQKTKTNNILFKTEKKMSIEDSLASIADSLLKLANPANMVTMGGGGGGKGTLTIESSPKSTERTGIIGDSAKPAGSAAKKPAGRPSKVVAPTEDEMAEQDEALTLEDVREVAGEVREKLGGKSVPAAKAAIDKVTKKFGGAKLADIDSKHYIKFIAALRALVPEDEPEEDEEEYDGDDE